MAEGTGIGAPVRRKEDERFLRGKGKYVDDITRPGQAYVYFLRSPYAHATIQRLDTSKAEAAPGVVAVFTGEDIEADDLGGLICGWTITQPDGSQSVQKGRFISTWQRQEDGSWRILFDSGCPPCPECGSPSPTP